MTKSIRSVRGMNDLLPGRLNLWYDLESAIRNVVEAYGYREIRTPLLEHTELFERSIGEQTDIVEKEMYTFRDNNGDSLTLRPEATAACVRAGIEHGFLYNQTQRLWYLGPMFRHERPQKGRYRQFHQFGIEALGWRGPDIDAEILLVGTRLWRQLGLTGLRLEINTLGSNEARSMFRESLQTYLSGRREEIDDDSRRRLQTNPLRILDSKDPDTQKVLEDGPDLSDYLGDDARANFDTLQNLLTANGVEYHVNTRLVRGLDYYTGPVFEWTTGSMGAQNAICAGGRYDELVSQLGGRGMPAAGFACGLERLVDLYENSGGSDNAEPHDVWICVLTEDAASQGFLLAEHLRDQHLKVIVNCGGGGLRKQLKKADQSGARFAVVIGEDELRSQTLTLKSLRTDEVQIRLTKAELVEYLKPAC